MSAWGRGLHSFSSAVPFMYFCSVLSSARVLAEQSMGLAARPDRAQGLRNEASCPVASCVMLDMRRRAFHSKQPRSRWIRMCPIASCGPIASCRHCRHAGHALVSLLVIAQRLGCIASEALQRWPSQACLPGVGRGWLQSLPRHIPPCLEALHNTIV